MQTQINISNTDNLFQDIRMAHRLLVAYYQRLLPTIQDIADHLGLNFYIWTPSEFSRPGNLTSNPFSKWQWDLLPANCTRYVFHNAKDNNKVQVGEFMVEFHVITDSGILKENDPNSHRAQPDALNLHTEVSSAESLVKIHLYMPYHNQDKNWHNDIFNICEDPKLTSEPNSQRIEEDGIDCYISGFEIPLSDLLNENAVKVITARIEQYQSHLLVVAKRESE
ncbi:MAG: hypothetical protein HRU40_19885 [Saprospiraceae bacterium]|nr:hypothetical protein [Saprospiraceae bacterium]